MGWGIPRNTFRWDNDGLLFSLETHRELLTASTAYQGKFRSDQGFYERILSLFVEINSRYKFNVIHCGEPYKHEFILDSTLTCNACGRFSSFIMGRRPNDLL
jgi:hypothetical protein